MAEPTTKIHGKRVTEPQLMHEIHSLLHGTGSRPYPLSVTEVAKTLDISRMTVLVSATLIHNIGPATSCWI